MCVCKVTVLERDHLLNTLVREYIYHRIDFQWSYVYVTGFSRVVCACATMRFETAAHVDCPGVGPLN